MTQLVLNNVDDDLADRLHSRAAAHGLTPEEEARRILDAALDDTLEDDEELPHFTVEENIKFSDFLASMPDVGRDEDFARLPGFVRAAEL